MKLNSTFRLWLMLVTLLSGSAAFAQQRPLNIALEHVRTHHADWNLTSQDVADLVVSDQYTDKSTGIFRVYFTQQYQGVPVYNAILNLNITKDGKVFHVGKRFVPGLANKVNSTLPALTAEDAVRKVMAHLELASEPLQLVRKEGELEFVFAKGNLTIRDIKAKLRYHVGKQGVQLAWNVEFAPKKSSDQWSMLVDAASGEILRKDNWTTYCKLEPGMFRHVDGGSSEAAHHVHEAVTYDFSSVNEPLYNVWPLPYESPIHGPRTMLTNPADPTASPFGWHDTDGTAGAEFTITQGNNVHAYADTAGIDSLLGDEPDGGADLHFDFFFDPALEPNQYQDAAITNLFYMNNVMHDFAYHYGFTEVEGNFQVNTYGNPGAGGDDVQAQGQDGGGTNNANFATPPDGSQPRMQMFLWGSAGSKFLTVDEPASVAGSYVTILPGTGWGAGSYITDTTNIQGEVVLVDDGFETPTDGCQALLNAAELNGKVAMIDRGDCQFSYKALLAQEAGAKAVVICNIPGATNTAALGAGANAGLIEIPVVMVSVEDCQTIRQFAGNGLVVTFGNPGVASQSDGDLDNGIISHEYGHGISNRLTGGPNNTGCLGNPEEMGEGWSDFMSLITTVYPGDTGTKKRGVGTYVVDGVPTGEGIRRFPYSTDMEVNPLTYKDVALSPEVHDLGEVWNVMIWDLYWAMVDEYGWDEDLYNGNGGNNMAIRLVFEGMKNQPCEPGFVDGRDAILAADEALYNGQNYCLIWKVFARRGLGVNASQGFSVDATDGLEGFKLPPTCIDAVLIDKTVTDFISAGQDIEVKINVGNFKQETITGVKITDQLPDGVGLKAGSSNHPATVQGNTVTFDLPDMAFLAEDSITYTLVTNPAKYSIRHWLDDVAEDDENWLVYNIPSITSPDPVNFFSTQDADAHSPEFSWFVEDIETESRQALELDETFAWTVTGARPVFRFYHRYDTEPGADGGVVEVRQTNEAQWTRVNGKILRFDYPGILQYGTFAQGNLFAFSGNSGPVFKATYVDLSEWAGKEIVVRFRFGTDANTIGFGWMVDDMEFMDLFAYNGEACISNNQGFDACDMPEEEGTIIESQVVSGTEDKQLESLQVALFPNPASDYLHLVLGSERQQDVNVSLLTLDGKQVLAQAANVFGNEVLSVNVNSLSAGLYFVKISTEEGVLVRKVIIE